MQGRDQAVYVRGHTHAHTPRRVARGSRLQRGRRGWLLENRASPPRKCAAGPPAARSRWCGMGGPSAAPPLVGGAKRDTVPGVFWKGRSIPPPHSGCCATRGGGPNTGSHKVLCRPTPTRQTHPALGVEGGGTAAGAVAEWKAAGDRGGNNQPFDGQKRAEKKSCHGWRPPARCWEAQPGPATRRWARLSCPRSGGRGGGDIKWGVRRRHATGPGRFQICGGGRGDRPGPARGLLSRARDPESVLMASCGGGGSSRPRKRAMEAHARDVRAIRAQPTYHSRPAVNVALPGPTNVRKNLRVAQEEPQTGLAWGPQPSSLAHNRRLTAVGRVDEPRSDAAKKIPGP